MQNIMILSRGAYIYKISIMVDAEWDMSRNTARYKETERAYA
jgi:hypothetical protein